MLKKNKKYLILTSVITLLPMLIGVLLWNRLPEKIATHFDINGQADGWSSKGGAIFGITLFIFAIHIFCAVGTAADPKKKSISEKVYHLILWISPVCSLFSAVLIYGNALNYKINATMVCYLFVGLMFVVIGNYLPKCRQNYTIGIKIPWTIDSVDNWNATHRIAGPLWIIGGIIVIAAGIMGSWKLWIFLTVSIAIAVIPCVYSFIYYIRHGK